MKATGPSSEHIILYNKEANSFSSFQRVYDCPLCRHVEALKIFINKIEPLSNLNLSYHIRVHNFAFCESKRNKFKYTRRMHLVLELYVMSTLIYQFH